MLRVVNHRLRKLKLSFMGISYDLTNAFGCTNHQVIHDKLLPTFRTVDRPLVWQRRINGGMLVDCVDGQLQMRNTSGGLIGCSNEPDAFMVIYYSDVNDYLNDTKMMASNKFLRASFPTWQISRGGLTGRPHYGCLPAGLCCYYMLSRSSRTDWCTRGRMTRSSR